MSGHRRKYPEDHFPHAFEIIVLLLIFLAICHLCLEELSVLLRWDSETHRNLVLAAFAFDLFFSLEFLARSMVSVREGRFLVYFTQQRGWVDFLSSIPLAILVSGPALVVLFSGNGSEMEHLPQYMVLLKTAKAVRVTRALRLIRMLRIFGRVQYTESRLTNENVSTVATITVTALIFSVFLLQMLPSSPVPGHVEYENKITSELNNFIQSESIPRYDRPDPALFSRAFPAIIELRNPDRASIYESKLDLPPWFLTTNISLADGYSARLSFFEADANLAMLILGLLAIILILLFCFVVLYGRMFVQEVAEPIYMMDRGLRQWNYNLYVPEPHRPSDEIVQLVQIYNRRWLPLKERIVAYYERKNKSRRNDMTAADHGRPLDTESENVSIEELI